MIHLLRAVHHQIARVGQLPCRDRPNNPVGQPIAPAYRDMSTTHPEPRPHLRPVHGRADVMNQPTDVDGQIRRPQAAAQIATSPTAERSPRVDGSTKWIAARV